MCHIYMAGQLLSTHAVNGRVGGGALGLFSIVQSRIITQQFSLRLLLNGRVSG